MSGWRRYGKGRHRAGLNSGDCFTYALADRTGHPVLCTGDDFAATDITVVRPGTELSGQPVLLSFALRWTPGPASHENRYMRARRIVKACGYTR
jgi:hypothetical protein